MQKPLINTLSEGEVIKWLEGRGYKVVKLKKHKNNLSDADIYELFYNKLKDVLSEVDFLNLTINNKEDKKSLDRFKLQGRSKGFDDSKLRKFLYDSIILLFNYYKELNLDNPPTNLSFLLSAKGRWILLKTNQIHNRKLQDYENSEEAEAWRNLIYNTEDDKFLELQRLTHNKIREEIEENGKKKEG